MEGWREDEDADEYADDDEDDEKEAMDSLDELLEDFFISLLTN